MFAQRLVQNNSDCVVESPGVASTSDRVVAAKSLDLMFQSSVHP